ncbi:MAG: hypothetical protein KDA24_25160 [Deltaproteobacteria bacterium]|nr:hypothetical protein [Deltaproteobacteria bacterium]
MKKPLSLGTALRHLDPLSGEALVALAHRLCNAVAEAEAQGLGVGVHGGRVALTPDSFAVELDSTLRMRPGQRSSDDRPGFRTWAAPEQLGPDRDGDVRAWVFSVAAILYEAATGDALFEANSPPEAESLVTGDLDGHYLLTGVRGRMKGAHPDLAGPVFTALAPAADERHADPRVMASTLPAPSIDGGRELDTLLRTAAERATPPAPPAPSVPIEPDQTEAMGGQSHEISLAPRGSQPRAGAMPFPEDDTPEIVVPTLRSTMEPPPAQNSRVRLKRQVPEKVLTTGQKIVRWGLVLVLLFGVFGGTLYLGLWPALPAALSGAVESAASPVGGVLPPAMSDSVAWAWTHRSDRAGAYALWDRGVEMLPEDKRTKYRRAVDPRAELTWAGEPTWGGIVGRIEGSLEPSDGDAAVELSFSHGVSSAPATGRLEWTATPIADPRPSEVAADIARVEGAAPTAATEPVEGEGATLTLPPGFWDVALRYSASDLAGPFEGTLAGLRVSPGHVSRYSAPVEVPAGRLNLSVEFVGGSSEGTPVTTVTLYAPAAGDAVRKAERLAMQTALDAGEPWHASVEAASVEGADVTWFGALPELPALPSGAVTARVAVDDGVHHPSVAWVRSAPVPGGDQEVARAARVELDEPVDPKGPGLRVRATNLQHDVSRHTTVYLFAAGTERAVAQGRGGRYFTAEPGTYDLRLIYEPPAAGLGVKGEQSLPGFVVAEEGVSDATVDIGFPAAWVRVAVMEDGHDVSEDVAVRIMRAGVDRVAGRPVVDETSVGEHVLPADTYDLYISRSKDGAKPLDAVFPGIQLAAGDVWQRELDVAKHPWNEEPAAP